MYNTTPDITEDYLIKNLSQEQIMQYYLGVPIKIKSKFSSPFRKDKNPSCSLIYKDGKLIFKDFAGTVKGNFVHIAMHIYRCNYYDALDRIAEDFNLKPTSKGSKVEKKEYTHLNEEKNKSFEPTKISIKHRKWNIEDKKYWGDKFKLNRKILKYFNVIPVDTAWINNSIIYNYYSKDDPCYAYRLGTNKYKLYFPLRKLKAQGTRFIHNTTKVQGYRQLPSKGKFLVLTKSMKDVMVFYKFKIPSIALAGETMYPPEKLIEVLKQRFENIYSLYDFDYTGIVMANFLKRTYNIKPMMLSNGTRGTKIDYEAKDLAEYIDRFGETATQDLINKLIAHFNEQIKKKQDGEINDLVNNEIPY